jgi:hypothetical protein
MMWTPKGVTPGLGIEHAQDLAQVLRVGAGDAGDHHVRLARFEQQGGEGVPVLVHRPLDLALQIAAALERL